MNCACLNDVGLVLMHWGFVRNKAMRDGIFVEPKGLYEIAKMRSF